MSNHATPIVATVLYIAEQRHPWKLAKIDRFAVAYHTPTTVRVGTSGGTTRHQHQVYCVADDAAWGRVLFAQAALQTDLNALADGLRQLGTYVKRLAEAGGFKLATNPLCRTVISAPDPDLTDDGYWVSRLVPRIERTSIRGHTPKMLRDARYEDGSVFAQRDHFVCRTESDWAGIEQLIAAAKTKAETWEQLLRDLGTYAEALADGRYTRKEAFMQTTTAPAQRAGVRPASSWGTTDIDSTLVGQLESAGYHWEMAKQTPDGHWHHLVSSRNTALLRNDQVLMRRERLEALLTPPAALTVAPAAGALSTGLQGIARDYIAAREKAGRALLEMASYLALARSMAKHGEWYTFLQATGTSEDQADRLLDIDRKASESPEYADAVRRNFLNPTTAALLARSSTPAAVVEQVLHASEPPSKRQVEQQIQAAKPNPAPVRDLKPTPALHPDYQHAIAAEKILATLDQWDDSARPARIREAYAEAQQIRDHTTRERAFAQIDRAVEGKLPAPAVPVQPAAPFWQALSANHPTAHLWTKTDDHTYRAACGQTTVGAPVGSIEGGHCSSCVRATWPQNQMPAPAADTITISTNNGPREITPLHANGVLALHDVSEGKALTHIASGKRVASFARHSSAGRAFDALSVLDWTQIPPDGGMPPALALAVARILVQHDDVDHIEQRQAVLARLEAQIAEQAAAATVLPTIAEEEAEETNADANPPTLVPADWEARYDEAEALATKALEYADGSTRFYSIAKAVQAALELASYLAGERLEDLADRLDDATYEALAAYRRAREPLLTLADLKVAE